MAKKKMSRQEALQKLGLEDRASAEEVKKAYRHLAIKYHPDKHPEDPKATERQFIDVTEAYDTLTSSAGADLQEMGLRGPEAFTSRLSRWAEEIGRESRLRGEELRRERQEKNERYRRREEERRKEEEKNWKIKYEKDPAGGPDKPKVRYYNPNSEPPEQKSSKKRSSEGKFLNLDELAQIIEDSLPKRNQEDSSPSRKQATAPTGTPATPRYQEWETHPKPKTKPAPPKPEAEFSTEEKIRHYYKQAADDVLKITCSGLALDLIVGRIAGKHKVCGGEINERVAQAVVYTKSVLYHQVKTIPKEEVAESSRGIAQASSIEKLLVAGSAAQTILEDWDVGRGTFLIADDDISNKERDYSQPRRYGLFFKSTYLALLPHCHDQKDIPRLAKLIDAAKLFEHKQNTFQENAEEIADLIATAVSGVTLEFAGEVLKKTNSSLKSHYFGERCNHSRKGIARQYLLVADSLDSTIRAGGHTPEEALEVLNLVGRIQGYGPTHFGLRSLKQLARFIYALGEIVPRDKLTLAQRLVEPLSVGGKGYGQDSLEQAAGSWRNIFRDILPFYGSLDEKRITLFNQAMVALEQIQGREHIEDGREVEFSWTKEITTTIEAAAYGGKLIVEEALQSPDPQKAIEEFGKFLREYKYSEFFPICRKKSWIPFTPTARQREAYTYLSELQNKHKGTPIKLSPDQTEKIVKIYFND